MQTMSDLAAQLEVLAPLEKDPALMTRFKKRIAEGKLTRDENPASHFCVMFAPWDPESREVFIGHHKKSGEWIFPGGHIDRGETLEKTLVRELQEEWGWQMGEKAVPEVSFYTILDIRQDTRPCREHYDVWYLFPVDRNEFEVDMDRLMVEFHEIGWMTIHEARELSKAPNTHWALDHMEQLLADR